MRFIPAQRAFTLVEVTLAMGVTAIALLTVFSLLPIGVQTNQNATQQSASADILSIIAADLRATPVTTPRGGAATSTQLNISIPAAGTAGNATLYFNSAGQCVTATNNPRYRATVAFIANTGGRTATWADVKLTWPAAVNPATGTPAGSAETFIAVDRN